MLLHSSGEYRSTSPRISFIASARAASPNPSAKDHAAAAASTPNGQISPMVQVNAVDTTPVATDSIPEHIRSVEAEADKIIAQVIEIRKTKPYEHTLTLKVELDVWDTLKYKYEDQVDFKMEYYATSGNFVVTWPTWVHENLDMLFGPFTKIAISDPLRFRCLYNKDMRIMIEKKASNLTPDLQFARFQDNGDLEDSIIVECAVHQPTNSLWKKAEDWVRSPHVRLVVAIDVNIDHPSPATGPKAKTSITMEYIDKLDLPPYGPIEIDGRTWGGKLNQILLRFYFLPDEAQDAQGLKFKMLQFDITPADVNNPQDVTRLDEALDTISDYLSSVTLDVITETVFQTCFTPDNPFDLRWDDFYKSFARGLRLDSLQRYNQYNNITMPQPRIPKVDVSKRRAENQEKRENRVKRRRAA